MRGRPRSSAHRLAVALLAGALAACAAPPPPPEHTIGRWHDLFWTQEHRIVERGEEIALVTTEADGRLREQPLEEMEPTGANPDVVRAYRATGSPVGEYVVIDRAGRLLFFDEQGFVRDAAPLRDDAPRPPE
jgi:hypothetical protein